MPPSCLPGCLLARLPSGVVGWLTAPAVGEYVLQMGGPLALSLEKEGRSRRRAWEKDLKIALTTRMHRKEEEEEERRRVEGNNTPSFI